MASYATTTTATLWYTWNSGMDTTCGTPATTIWANWLLSTGTENTFVYTRPPALAPASAAEQAARAERAERARAAREAREATQAAADARAKQLLLSALTPAQRAEYAEATAFTVDTPDGRHFRIRRGRSHNIDELDATGQVLATYCVHPVEAVPHEDTMLTQLLYLRHDPAPLLATANRAVVRAGRH